MQNCLCYPWQKSIQNLVCIRGRLCRESFPPRLSHKGECVMQILEDGGAIYTLSNQPDSQIYGNYIHDIVPSPTIQRPIVRGIYLDEGLGGITIGNNAIEKSPIEEIGFHMVEEIIINQNCCQVYNKDIRKYAGLEQAYADLLHKVY
jgi:hypothetical protein